MTVGGTVRNTLSASIAVGREQLRRSPGHLLLAVLLQAAVIFIVGQIIPGVDVSGLLTAVIASVIIGLLNALVRPIFILLTLPLTVVTFGLVSLLINASIILLAAPLVPGLDVAGFLPAFALAVILTVATTAVNVILSVDDDESFYAELTRRIRRSSAAATAERGKKGLVIIQIDGLAAPILANAIRVGLVPHMARWVRDGKYRLIEWECPPPSQTSASQAGILLGRNDDIPAFRWYEKESGRLMVSNKPADATEIERRLSTGDGLLHPDGVSVGNLFSGDGGSSAFVMSRIRDPLAGVDVDAFSNYFIDPAAFVRTVMLGISEFVKELLEARRQRNQDIEPRVHRGRTFAFLRAATNVFLRDLNTTIVVRSMATGMPMVYVDFTDYDEIAHHAGPERLESLRALTGVDRAIASIEQASLDAARDYEFILLSDHGQTQGATFLQRYGETLEDTISGLMGAPQSEVVAATGRAETYGQVNAVLTELTERQGVMARLTGWLLRGRKSDGNVELGDRKDTAAERRDAPEAELVVCGSGNLANVYFTASNERMTAEQIEARYPGLLNSLASHPGIGLVMARLDSGDSVVIGPRGVHNLATDRVEGEDPLGPFGARADDHLRRLDSFAHVGDLLVNSIYDAELDEVAAFEELVGSHGGMGGPQTRPFLLVPTHLAKEAAPLVGAPAVSRQLSAWATEMGVDRTGPAAAIEPEDKPRPRGLAWVAAYQFLIGALLLLFAGAAFAVIFGAAAELDGEQGAQLVGLGIVILVLALLALATAWGVWKRRRWAWMATLAINGLNVLQAVFALASGGWTGLVGFGLGGALISVVVFYYMTRPHVAAAFGRISPQRTRRATTSTAD